MTDIDFINQLLSYLHAGFQKPARIIRYLRSRGKCCESDCKKGCDYFLNNKPWTRLPQFFDWAKKWYPSDYEAPINAFFTLPRVVQFLKLYKKLDEATVLKHFGFEFAGKLKRPRELPIPPCLFRCEKSVEIRKEFLNEHRNEADVIDRGLACDFFLQPPLPPIVAEIKLSVPQKSQAVSTLFNGFKQDLDKCKIWLSHPAVKAKFGFDFKYALAILIDLSGKQEIRDKWSTEINEKELQKHNIFVQLISPTLSLCSS